MQATSEVEYSFVYRAPCATCMAFYMRMKQTCTVRNAVSVRCVVRMSTGTPGRGVGGVRGGPIMGSDGPLLVRPRVRVQLGGLHGKRRGEAQP